MISERSILRLLIKILLISGHIHRYIPRSVSKVDAVRSEMVDEVLQHVHLVGGDVVEGDGEVTAAREALLVRVELIRPVPTVVRNDTRDEVVSSSALTNQLKGCRVITMEVVFTNFLRSVNRPALDQSMALQRSERTSDSH